MRCKKLDEKCNSRSCPYLQHLLVARRFDNWENLFESCKHLDAKSDAEEDLDEFDLIDEEMEAG